MRAIHLFSLKIFYYIALKEPLFFYRQVVYFAAKAEPIAILISLLLPENYSETKLKKIIKQLELALRWVLLFFLTS